MAIFPEQDKMFLELLRHFKVHTRYLVSEFNTSTYVLRTFLKPAKNAQSFSLRKQEQRRSISKVSFHFIKCSWVSSVDNIIGRIPKNKPTLNPPTKKVRVKKKTGSAKCIGGPCSMKSSNSYFSH